MRIIADFHLHSKFSRATSRDMVIDNIAKWATWKGINLIGTADFTHPLWFSEIKNQLNDLGNGLFSAKNFPKIKFILTTEISCIYSEGGQVRKVHNVIFAPSLEAVEKINRKLSVIGNLYSDGRPILGLSSYDLTKIILEVDKNCLIIPAHAWTPWFSIFGSKSGFNSIEECFRDLSKEIFAVETGLSSDPEMNWRLSKLDPIALISCSDAHSPANLGREATVFEFKDNNYGYQNIIDALKFKKNNFPNLKDNPLKYTIEFFPEEGKYHFDGHRLCNATCLNPTETKKYQGICPVCKKPLTVGVMNRVEELADRPEGYHPSGFPGSKHLVPLQEIIAESFGVQKNSVRVQEEYQKMVYLFNSEFNILLDEPIENIAKNHSAKIAEGISFMREGKVKKIPGYDGVYGIVKVFDAKERQKNEPKQKTLF